MEHVGALYQLARRGGDPLNEVVVIGIDAGYHVLPERLAEFVHHGNLLALGQGAVGGEHDLEVELLILITAEDVTPESHVIVTLHVGNDLVARLLGPQTIRCLDVEGVQIVR